MGHAETGSGKTAAFLLPIINEIINKKALEGEGKWTSKRSSPFALIIEPTRELALQVYEQSLKFTYGNFLLKIFYFFFVETGVTVAKAYGKYETSANLREISTGCDILIATIGRLKHISGKRYV